MLKGTGYFDKLGNPCIKFHLNGVYHQKPGIEYEAVIDTGFTGFISLPITTAFTLGLPLYGTASPTLADGTQSTCITAQGKATFSGQTKIGVVVLQASSQEILLGMDFLRQFHLSLVVTNKQILLLDEDWINKVAAASEAEEKNQKSGQEKTAAVLPEGAVTAPKQDDVETK